MPRPNQSEQKRKQLLPIIGRVFAKLGYRRTTTAELAKRCRVRENILYRLWPDKKAMFLASIDYVYDLSTAIWQGMLEENNSNSSIAERILDYEARHHGEFGLYRIVFAGLSETDDPQIRRTLKNMFERFHRFIHQQIKAHGESVFSKDGRAKSQRPDEILLAWAVIGLGTVANIGREMKLLTVENRRRLIAHVGRLLLEGRRA